jgi:hypothetical protein
MVAVLLLALATPARAQLIAPGKLSRAHADLAGITKCTLCHELRHKGISPALCLDCHKPLAREIEARGGFHGSLAEKDCAACHREHFGASFTLVRLDTATFDHARAGWTLTGRHARTACRDCHKPEFVRDPEVRAFTSEHGALDRTYLGLSRSCESCHVDDSPHGDQFKRESCGACHTAVSWKTAAAFDHDQTSFGLTGAHLRVECDRCHTSTPRGGGKPPLVKYAGVPTQCSTCHEADSPHGTQFAGRSCGECHDADGWKPAGRFHHDRAPFALTGKHRQVECAKCHTTSPGPRGRSVVRYRGIAYSSCGSCHQDPHHGAMKKECAACHSTGGWSLLDSSSLKGSFDHTTTGFALEGKHAVVACADCHDARTAGDLKGVHIRFVLGTETHSFPKPEASTCQACHVDVHGGVFARRKDRGTCDACHREDAWTPATFDVVRHDRETRFPLKGAHIVVPCESCHQEHGAGPPKFDLGSVTCRSCHEASNPHGDQFEGRACGDCHTVASFGIDAFDHSKTRFSLEGAHRDAPCSACHHTEHTAGGKLMVRYRPLGTECRDCHGGVT